MKTEKERKKEEERKKMEKETKNPAPLSSL